MDDIQHAQHEMLLKEVIGDLERIKKKVKTLLNYHNMTVRINDKEKNKKGNKDRFTA